MDPQCFVCDSRVGEAKHVLVLLDAVTPSHPEFDDLLTKLIPAAREHIPYEEKQVWPALREALSAAEAEDLGANLTDAKKAAPTRPHPATPASPAVLKTAGPAIAATARAATR